VVSVFENSTTKLQYDYVSNEKDGRGYTCGRAGFTTADGDARGVIKQYNKPSMNVFIPTLTRLEQKDDDSTKDLDKLGWTADWKAACKDPDFIAAQDFVSDAEYYTPAVKLAQSYVSPASPLMILSLYDTCVEHGATGPDSMTDIVKRSLVNGSFDLKSFLTLRRQVLLNPQDKSTKKEWSESVGRVDALLLLLKQGNLNLATPFQINPWGDDQPFTIKGDQN
jgi:chitosanase